MVRSALLVVTFSLSAALLPYAQDPLQERSSAAVASRALRQAYFDANGEPPLPLELAFPHLAGASLADPSFLAARGRTLAARRDACARERFDAGDGDRAEPVRAACDAEDAAAALEERLLSALPMFSRSAKERVTGSCDGGSCPKSPLSSRFLCCRPIGCCSS